VRWILAVVETHTLYWVLTKLKKTYLLNAYSGKRVVKGREYLTEETFSELFFFKKKSKSLNRKSFPIDNREGRFLY